MINNWYTPEEAAPKLRYTVEMVRLLCKTGQIAWRPQNPTSTRVRYLISDQAIQDYERATTVQARVRPIRRSA